MVKKLLALMATVPLVAVLAQQEPHRPAPSIFGGTHNAEENKPTQDPMANYGGNKSEAALAAFHGAYEAAGTMRTDRAIRLFLLSLRRNPTPKTLYDLAIVCARDYRWDDALGFQREAQQQTTDPDVAKLAAVEVERLSTIADLESTPAGKRRRAFDIRFVQVLKAKSPFAAIDELKLIAKLDGTRWEAPALEGILYAEVHKFPESMKAFDEAARLAPPDRAQHLKEAAGLARREANFNEQRLSADELWEKQKYADAAQHYQAAWESSPEQLDVGLKAATGFLLDDKVEPAVGILVHMRASATGEMGIRIAGMLNELGAVSEQAKTAASATGPSELPSEETPARVRRLAGKLTSHQMELAAQGDPALLEDKTFVAPVPDDEINGSQANLPMLLKDSVYALYKRDQPAPVTPPAPVDPAPNPALLAPAPGTPAPAPEPPAPPPSAPPILPAVEPTRPQADAARPGDIPLFVISDPPGAVVTFDKVDHLNCTAPCEIHLSAGRHTLVATMAGYRDALRVLPLDRGKKPAPYTIAMEAKRGSVSVESATAGLPIFVNGKKTDSRTPTMLSLMEGPYQISVEIDGRMVTQEIGIQDGSISKIKF